MTMQKNYWSDNLKFLRNRKKLSQEDLAEKLNITRSKLAAHESGTTKNPLVEDIIHFSDFFKISIDSLLKVDLSKLTELKLRDLEAGNDVYISGGNIRVIPITVTKENRENVEYVPIKAKAGYLAGYNDPEFIKSLPKGTLPHLSSKKTYRMFPTEGDSMLPIPQNSIIIGEYLLDWSELHKTTCVVIMQSEQTLLFKQVSYQKEQRTFLFHSLNTVYQDQEVAASDIGEIWKYHSHITDQMPNADNSLGNEILKVVRDIQVNIKKLK